MAYAPTEGILTTAEWGISIKTSRGLISAYDKNFQFAVALVCSFINQVISTRESPLQPH